MKRFLPFTIHYLLFTVFITGCASTSYVYRAPDYKPSAGIYHKVEKGQTLWRIAKTYNVDLQEVVKINRISNPAKIRIGQLIFIPEAKQARKVSMSRPVKPSKRGGFIWPVNGKVVSFYGAKSSAVKNKGIDIEVYEGADVVAAKSGKVTFSQDRLKGFGRTVVVDHGDGYSTVYAYNARNLVETGDYVEQNEVIAKAGSSGRAKKAKLHFEIRRNHKPQNPFYHLP